MFFPNHHQFSQVIKYSITINSDYIPGVSESEPLPTTPSVQVRASQLLMLRPWTHLRPRLSNILLEPQHCCCSQKPPESQPWLHTGTIWKAFKKTNKKHYPFPKENKMSISWGSGQSIGNFSGFPFGSKVQPGFRTTAGNQTSHEFDHQNCHPRGHLSSAANGSEADPKRGE